MSIERLKSVSWLDGWRQAYFYAIDVAREALLVAAEAAMAYYREAATVRRPAEAAANAAHHKGKEEAPRLSAASIITPK